AARPAAKASATRPAPPLRVAAVSPANGARDANGAGTVTVTYNQPLPASAPLPVLAPRLAGTWRRTGDTAVFSPAQGYAPGTRVTVAVPGAAGGAPALATASFT